MTYFRELPDIEYLSFLEDRINSNEYLKVKNLFRKAKLRDDIANPLIVFDKYEIPDGYRPDTVAEELYGSTEYDWIVLISAGIVNVRNEWPISDSDVYRYSYEQYGEELYGTHHYITLEQKDSNGRVVLDGERTVSNIIQIPFPSYDDGELDASVFFNGLPNSGVQTSPFYGVKGNLYVHDISTLEFTDNYGSFIVNQDLNVGYGGTWTYQLNLNILDDLTYTDNEAVVFDTIQYLSEDGYLKIFKVETTVDNTDSENLEINLSVNINSSEISYMTFYDAGSSNYTTRTQITKPITNYQSEIDLNNKKRSINVLKREYIQEFIRDTRSIMTYKESSQLVEDEDGNDIIRTENVRTTMPYGSTFDRPNPSETQVNII